MCIEFWCIKNHIKYLVCIKLYNYIYKYYIMAVVFSGINIQNDSNDGVNIYSVDQTGVPSNGVNVIIPDLNANNAGMVVHTGATDADRKLIITG